MEPENLTLADGRTIQYFIDEDGSDSADVLVYHHGTPAAGPLSGPLLDAARSTGFRLVQLVRPGYGGSTREPGRSIADVVPLVEALADHLDAERFATIGWSGGGPHAIATAALLPERCAAALSLAGVAPWPADGLDWLAGMGQDNIEEFGASIAGAQELEAYLTPVGAALATVNGQQIIEEMGSLLPPVDRTHLTGAFGDDFAATVRWSLSTGIWGWFDDDLAFTTPWGFDLDSLAVPVLVWQGSEDLMVPFAHGEWLAARLPTAVATLEIGEGHLSLVAGIESGLVALRSHI
jgi:pimeloyl-ACP methyl ester carboxylesterase